MRYIIPYCVALLTMISCQNLFEAPLVLPDHFDWQGHRGCRGILPENSMPGFYKALEYPIKTLELDVVVTKDSQLVISHEPWFNPSICLFPDGSRIPDSLAMQFSIYKMDYMQIRDFDCGSIGNPRFPEQTKIQATKPLLAEMIGSIETFCEDNGRAKPHYNIELKSRDSGYDLFIPQPETFVRLALDMIGRFNIRDRVTLQSFDPNVINALYDQQSKYKTAYLVENDEGLVTNLQKLKFVPEVYSPKFQLLDTAVVRQIHNRGMQVIPWTVNEVEDMKTMIKMGVDGIITDYPNRISAVIGEQE